MATFAEYPAHTMASNDFTLYPYSEAWNQDQSYLPTTTYADQSCFSTTTYDSYQDQYSYAPMPEQFGFHNQHAYEQAKNRLQAPSPANSASFDYPQPPALSNVSDSGASVHSTISSAMGSPSAQPQSGDWHHHNARMFPGIVQQSDSLFSTSGFEFENIPVTDKGCVDPSLIQPFSPPPFAATHFPESQAQNMSYSAISSPVPHRLSHSREPSVRPQGSASPFMRQHSWQQQPYPQYQASRRQSISSVHSRQSQHSHTSEESNKGLCPIATCGRHVKDLKAHMLTHQNERPEKCPIPTCEYHTKGFARKYDKNRHTLTHYKGTMVCGFCPGSGSAVEKSFNRADVFKRHLTSVHGVEQTPPNARRKSPSAANKKPYAANGSREASGMCSTCGNTFASAQDFYEHLDDCVLRVVQQTDPSEAINEKLLTEISEDRQVQDTLEKHMLPTNVDLNAPTTFDGAEEEDDEDIDEDDANDTTYGSRKAKRSARKLDATRIANNGAISKPTSSSATTTKKGLTYSKNGVPLAGPATQSGKGNKRRKNYPLSWGAAPDQMRMKKRVLAVYDGQRRLWKDDMMLDADHEVRIPLPGLEERAYVTDLDVATLQRAEGVLNATEEEKGPWMPDEELERLMQ